MKTVKPVKYLGIEFEVRRVHISPKYVMLMYNGHCAAKATSVKEALRILKARDPQEVRDCCAATDILGNMR